MKALQWDTCSRRGYAVEVTHIGRLEATLVCGGAAALGRNVWIGSLAGEVVAICETRDKAIAAIRAEARVLLCEAVAVLEARQ